MTSDAQQFLAEVLNRVELHGSFSPYDIGKRIELTRSRAEAAARELSNAGILELGFDSAAQFSTDYRKLRGKSSSKKHPQR